MQTANTGLKPSQSPSPSCAQGGWPSPSWTLSLVLHQKSVFILPAKAPYRPALPPNPDVPVGDLDPWTLTSFKEQCDDRGRLQSLFLLPSWPPRWACQWNPGLLHSIPKLQTPHVAEALPAQRVCSFSIGTCSLMPREMAVTAWPQGQRWPRLPPVAIQEQLPVGLVQSPLR